MYIYRALFFKEVNILSKKGHNYSALLNLIPAVTIFKLIKTILE